MTATVAAAVAAEIAVQMPQRAAGEQCRWQRRLRVVPVQIVPRGLGAVALDSDMRLRLRMLRRLACSSRLHRWTSAGTCPATLWCASHSSSSVAPRLLLRQQLGKPPPAHCSSSLHPRTMQCLGLTPGRSWAEPGLARLHPARLLGQRCPRACARCCGAPQARPGAEEPMASRLARGGAWRQRRAWADSHRGTSRSSLESVNGDVEDRLCSKPCELHCARQYCV